VQHGLWISNSALWGFPMDYLLATQHKKYTVTRNPMLSVASRRPSYVTSPWNWRAWTLNPYLIHRLVFLHISRYLFGNWTFVVNKESCCKCSMESIPNDGSIFCFFQFSSAMFGWGCKIGRMTCKELKSWNTQGIKQVSFNSFLEYT